MTRILKQAEANQWSSLVREHFDISKPILLACSGGMDSMFLAAALIELKATMLPSLILEIAHVNYGLRPGDCDLDQKLVEQLAREHQLPCHVKRVEDNEHQSGIQEWARDLRYAFFQALLSRSGGYLALAHQRDDLVENVILRLVRGCGLDAAGMKSFEGYIWRPLLSFSREEIARRVAAAGIPYRDDTSNAKTIYKRNKVRLEGLPWLEELQSGAVRKIASWAADLQEFEADIASRYRQLWEQNELSYEAIKCLPPAVGRHVLALFITHKAGKIQLSRRLLVKLWTSLKGQLEEGQKKLSEDLPGSYRAVLSKGKISLVKKSNSFSLRSKQHRANIRLLQLEPLLEDGAAWVCDFSSSRSLVLHSSE